MNPLGRLGRPWGFAAAWVAATVLAVLAGLVAVDLVGASVRGRGPLGDAVTPLAEEGQPVEVDPEARKVSRSIDGEWGAFLVECRGVYAVGLRVTPNEDRGWRVVSYERGPDDDVDAVFADGRRSVELEIFCNRGRPTVGELERNTLPGTGAGTPD